MIQIIKKIKKRILAIWVAVPEMPLNPKIAAMMAMIRKTTVQWSMGNLPGLKEPCNLLLNPS
jgi:hypothetical protein